MAGIIALYGSGEFTPAMSEVDLYILGKTPAPNVVVLPTAAGSENNYRQWIQDGIAHYQSLGIEVAGLDIANADDANDKSLVKELDNYSCIVFSGGDPAYLLGCLQDSLLWQEVLKLHAAGATIIGSSAGAMVLGPQVWSRVYDFDKKGETYPWEPGLGLIDFGVIPHFDMVQTRYTEETIIKAVNNFPDSIKIVGIDENTAYIKINDEWIRKGKGKVHDPIQLP